MRTIRLTIGQKLLLLVAGPLILQVFLAFKIGSLLEDVERLAAYEYSSKELIGRINWLQFLILSSLYAWAGEELSGRHEYRRVFDNRREKVSFEFTALETLLSERPKQLVRLNGLKSQYEAVLNLASSLTPTGGETSAKKFFANDKTVRLLQEGAQLRSEILEADRSPYRVEGEMVTDSRNALKLLIKLGVAVNTIAALLLVSFFGVSVGLRLSRLAENSLRLSDNEPLLPPLGGTDEIAMVDQVFRHMADRLKESAEKEKAVITNAVDVICSIDMERCFSSVNPAANKLLGYEPEELIGTPVEIYAHAPDRELLEAKLSEMMKVEQPMSLEARMVRKDGSTVDVLLTGRWSELDRKLFCVLHDITELKQVERMRQEIVSMVSHDLRTPLTTIRVVLDMLGTGRAGDLSDQGQHLLDRASHSCDRILTLSTDLLDIHKLEAGMLQLKYATTSSRKILQQCAQVVAGQADLADVRIDVKDGDIQFEADEDRMIQVLVNLVSNAVKFSPRGATVSVLAVQDAELVRFEVQDAGRGIPADRLETIFDRFRQAHADDDIERKGTGLGLAICKALVELHGGRIWCESVEGQGSNFAVTIPPKES